MFCFALSDSFKYINLFGFPFSDMAISFRQLMIIPMIQRFVLVNFLFYFYVDEIIFVRMDRISRYYPELSTIQCTLLIVFLTCVISERSSHKVRYLHHA